VGDGGGSHIVDKNNNLAQLRDDSLHGVLNVGMALYVHCVDSDLDRWGGGCDFLPDSFQFILGSHDKQPMDRKRVGFPYLAP
jgi:hypothetical protein